MPRYHMLFTSTELAAPFEMPPPPPNSFDTSGRDQRVMW